MISREENAQSTCKTGGETVVESENANEPANTGDIVNELGITLDPLLSDLSTSTNTVDEEDECGHIVEKDHILRKMTKVDCEKVTNHLKTMIFTEHGDDYQIALCNIIDWHQQLIYDGNKKGNQDGKIAYCKPVGLRNLGATCYLNSQLQCLVANLPFVEGVFNWTEKGGSMNQMNLVISRLQCILARMIYGPHNVVCTDEFSSSMAIENDEMQDPNEFARLLLDRMDESFQRDSAELRNLLPSIFRGTFEFATKCMQCQKVSRRQENFMDINVPMMPLTSSAKEVTIEQLLAEYFKPEKLDGENKYMCGECNDICDAERSISFVATPPVLNIQLARYVFNLKTYRKQKLMNKVMLPRFLFTDENNSDKRKYILCAVQNHRGSSAYSGHYVAEVMDWITGVWFEFDDERVTLLEHGPSSSYDPDRNLGTRLKGGTSDAYNLFYVEESFLRKSVLLSIDRMNSTRQDVVKALTVERQDAFEVEKQ
jgi:ubiquitin carboxyl-terminal hydrolase 48